MGHNVGNVVYAEKWKCYQRGLFELAYYFSHAPRFSELEQGSIIPGYVLKDSSPMLTGFISRVSSGDLSPVTSIGSFFVVPTLISVASLSMMIFISGCR